ncbi:GNAT family N-acetyltransferase [Latilactobacillus graminis]|uniref:Acetyltransferase family protein n=2 Tax=Latilactobacillus graminis TaxID=60519 RepID=A0AA89I623_9LACO|nr:GNAT family N-acetyltransferase [Latilactobacillus graminis]KRM21054.1 acetyltransferase family protein [Latilactobacillus graminis DSM 20719]QFP79187.1 GNAT family N-acetyltransferase [Latilactobacillus graminis]
MQVKQTQDLKSVIYQASLAIRKAVFVVEQHVPAELEVDEFEDQAIYFVGYVDDQAVVTLRLIEAGSDYHVQRVAVSRPARRHGYGHQLMRAAEAFARQSGKKALTLNAQLSAVAFYNQLGFQATDKPPFLDAGINHQEMVKKLTA